MQFKWHFAGGLGLATCIDTPSNVSVFFQKEVRKRANIRNQYNQAPHRTQDTNGKVTTSQLDITNENQEVSPLHQNTKALIRRGVCAHWFESFLYAHVNWFLAQLAYSKTCLKLPLKQLPKKWFSRRHIIA